MQSSDPPRNPNGRKIGYMKLMLQLWNEKGYENLGLSAQNLSDRARDLECKQTEILSSVSQTVDEERIIVDNTSLNTNTTFVDTTFTVKSDLSNNDKYSDF